MKCPISPGMVCFKMKCPFHYLTRNDPPYVPKWNALFIISPGMVLLMFLKALLIWLESVKLQRKKGRSGRLHRGHVETNHGAAWLQWTMTNCLSVKGYKQAFQIGHPRCRLMAKDKNCNWKNASNYRVYQLSCNIKNRCISASKKDNLILKKVLKSFWKTIFAQ